MTKATLEHGPAADDVLSGGPLSRGDEVLSATATIADVVAGVGRMRGLGLEATRVHVALADGPTDPLTERALAQRRTLYFADRAELAAAFPQLDDPGEQARVCVPLIGAAGALGALHLAWDVPRMFFVAQRAEIATLAMHVTQALERARQLEARIRVAAVLQQAILPRLPAANGYEMAARYLPAEDAEAVGGDWYDAITGADGRLTMVIGDVTGHDMAAAAGMGQLRGMLRAYLVDRHEPPSALLHRLDAANHALGEPVMATAIVAVLDRLATGGHRLRWSNAGHPPPLLIHRDGTVEALTGNDMLLGVSRFARRHTWTHPLPAGATVLLHTDGLVDHRGHRLDDASALLHRRLRTARRTRVEHLLEDMIAGVPARHADDIAMLAVRVPAGAGPG
jgi:serine phosphatase RsbU (regulator of sigma subunit)